ncbi:hypothetical protein GALMADRAFT_506130 [Galerina marginata CBS 339.88]|uniref:Uncharacterized protein n=1 Tax=Galerina marginata (strain CBS 339.88) TaxID=685588 RepID=A0A067TA09_GALM3|nr:hypothetical protein GALMADRAFT_506130 [Galerina marginata CBS 339.88]
MDGLEDQRPDTDSSFRSHPKTIQVDPWSPTQSGGNFSQQPSQQEYSYTSPPPGRDHHARPQSYKNRHAVTDLELHTFSDTEPLVHIRLPQAQNISSRQTDSDPDQWPPHGKSYPYAEAHSAPVPLNGRTRAISVTNTPWNDRSLPFISSMRRTSHPNLSQKERESRYSDQGGVSQSRIPSQSLSAGAQSTFGDREAAVRYEDVNMHRDGFLANRGYLQHGYDQASQSRYINEGSRGPYDKRGHHR